VLVTEWRLPEQALTVMAQASTAVATPDRLRDSPRKTAV
jgi:hypothetical protein